VSTDSEAVFFGSPATANIGTKRDGECGLNWEIFPMTLVNRLSVVAAYVAFAFVAAIVLGLF
jgi:hypothetical protein